VEKEGKRLGWPKQEPRTSKFIQREKSTPETGWENWNPTKFVPSGIWKQLSNKQGKKRERRCSIRDSGVACILWKGGTKTYDRGWGERGVELLQAGIGLGCSALRPKRHQKAQVEEDSSGDQKQGRKNKKRGREKRKTLTARIRSTGTLIPDFKKREKS